MHHIGHLECGIVCLQVSVAGACYLFDVLCIDPLARDFVKAAIKQLMEDSELRKIMHDCAPQTVAMRSQFLIKCDHIFDLQVQQQAAYMHADISACKAYQDDQFALSNMQSMY